MSRATRSWSARSTPSSTSARPNGIRYATFKLDDGATFVHIAQVDAERNPLGDLQAFRTFQEGIAERCIDAPVAHELDEIGSFGLFTR